MAAATTASAAVPPAEAKGRLDRADLGRNLIVLALGLGGEENELS